MSVVGTFIVPHPPIILPEVGRGEEKKIEKTARAYRAVAKRIAELKPDTIVITSPHSVMYADYFHISPGSGAEGDLRAFGVSGVLVKASYDEVLAKAVGIQAEEDGIPAGTLGEKDPALDHGTLIPLWFLAPFKLSSEVVRIGLSGLPMIDHYRLGESIAKAADKLDRRIVIVASGDLSHKLKEDGPYGFASEGPVFDADVTAAMKRADFLRFLTYEPGFCEKAAECGLGSFAIMAGTLDGTAVEPELLSYEGPFGVGYAVAAFRPLGKTTERYFEKQYIKLEEDRLKALKSQEDEYVRLARYALEAYVKTGVPAKLPKELPGELTSRQVGVFVSLKKHGKLRGCIGTIAPVTGSVAEEILRNAVSAGMSDPRFPQVKVSELEALVYSVDVLSTPEAIGSANALDSRRYGVIVTKGHKRGLLLPNLDGVDSVEQQIAIAKQKAGIAADEACELQRFEVVRHS
ncbi:AmmeMemoRadiSam system protein A [Eubacterium maltosivorans]|uniref:AmmeMemoRadiSam system protein A n=1 Tax=Eubacterium maltosivorans TaxID=2041044 RepID=A0A4P9C6H3_EUBML|nr:AmmeMemoRadiSam system protein A [Eubacterium maltosivorans]QCT70281.1 AmmeMemoRadiSam system protein A [Eubacterium maltosivorans]